MKRLLAILFVVAVALIVADHSQRAARRSARLHASALRPLAPVAVEQVGAFQIAAGGRSWTYVQRDSSWRYPAYFDAFVQSNRVDQYLKSLLQATGTVVGSEPGDWQHFGLAPGRAVKTDLVDPAGKGLLSAWIGRGAPGPGAAESYVRLASADTVYHLHANPLLALDNANPPMLDRRVLPQVLARRSIAKITFEHQGPLQTLRRVETAAFAAAPGASPEGPTYAWLAAFAAAEDTVLNANAFAYTSFLTRLIYEALHDPRTPNALVPLVGKLHLEDDAGTVDVLEVGGPNAEGHTYLRHATTGHLYSLSAPKAALLFPSQTALTDTLPDPSPYQSAQPYGPSMFGM